MDPVFWLDAFPLNGETRFFLFNKKYYFLENTWSCHLFLKGKTKQEIKTLSMTLEGKTGL